MWKVQRESPPCGGGEGPPRVALRAWGSLEEIEDVPSITVSVWGGEWNNHARELTVPFPLLPESALGRLTSKEPAPADGVQAGLLKVCAHQNHLGVLAQNRS